jgi:hypothetical protein
LTTYQWTGEAWHRFERARGSYAGRLEVLAAYWATPATLWDGPKKVGVSSVHEEQTPAPARPSRVAGRPLPAAEDAVGQATRAPPTHASPDRLDRSLPPAEFLASVGVDV